LVFNTTATNNAIQVTVPFAQYIVYQLAQKDCILCRLFKV